MSIFVFQEISLLSQFRHDNIVRYLGTDKVCCFPILLEFVWVMLLGLHIQLKRLVYPNTPITKGLREKKIRAMGIDVFDVVPRS